MNSVKNWVHNLYYKAKQQKVLTGGIIAVLILIGFIVFGGDGNGDREVVTVIREDVVDAVRISGTVEAQIVSDMGFETSGVVRTVSVKEGNHVFQGQQLASLSLGTLLADLQSAQANLTIVRAEYTNTSISFDTIRDQHDTLVQNAYSELLSEGLTAEPQSNTYDQTAPTITGRYNGPEGTYKIRMVSAGQGQENNLYVFDLENPEPLRVNKTGPTPLGTRGLFVSFPDGASDYRDTTWFITIPNEESAVYAANYNAYQDAVQERERSLEEAENELREGTAGASIAQAELAQAEAGVARIQAQIAQRILTAPFAGTVTAVNIDPGETAQTERAAISLISDGGFGVEVDLPEIDSVKVRIENPATVVLDALGEATPLPARVVSVNRAETIVDGVPIYEARLAFDVEDARITSGMTADVEIITDQREDVLTLPFRALQTRDNGDYFVTILEGDTEREVDVTIGLRGSDGTTQILAGLDEGMQVLVPTE